MVSRDVKLVEEQALEANLLASTPADPLKLCLQIRECQARQLQLLESAYGDQLNARQLPKNVATEVDLLRQQVLLQGQATIAFEDNYQAAQSALKESNTRLLEAEMRVKDLSAELQLVRAELEKTEAERDAARRTANLATQALKDKEREVGKQFVARWGGPNPWKIQTAKQLYFLVEPTQKEQTDPHFGPPK